MARFIASKSSRLPTMTGLMLAPAENRDATAAGIPVSRPTSATRPPRRVAATEQAVRDTNQAFYDAHEARDLAAMTADFVLWG